MDRVQKHDSSKCNTPLSEPFRTELNYNFYLKLSINQTLKKNIKEHSKITLGIKQQKRVYILNHQMVSQNSKLN
jgi:hypothetical protein